MARPRLELLARHAAVLLVALMKLVIAATGASGTIYLQRLLEQIDCAAHEVHLVMSAYAREVAKQELVDFRIPAEVSHHSESDMNVPFVSGSARFDAIVLPAIPSFYSRPNSLAAVVDTVVWRILDHIGLPSQGAYRWGEQTGSAKTSHKKS